MFFSFDWQVELIISYLEDFFSSAIASFEPRDYRVVFVLQKIREQSSRILVGHQGLEPQTDRL